MPFYPIQEIACTVEGEGPHSGEIIMLIRFGLSPDLTGLHVIPKPLKDTPTHLMTEYQILEALSKYPDVRKIHIGGEDPCLCDLGPLGDLLLQNRYERLMIDTFGYRPIWRVDPHIIWSIAPRIGFEVDYPNLANADEIRLYVSSVNNDWNLLTDKIMDQLAEEQCSASVALMPREMSEETILMVFRKALAWRHRNVKAAIPLYRTFPRIDEAAEFIVGG